MKIRSIGLKGRIATRALAALSSVLPSPVRRINARLGGEPGTPEYSRAYTRDQFLKRARHGMGLGEAFPPLWGKDVLEIGCGHGGITCLLASLGAKSVCGVDVNLDHVRYGEELAAELSNGGAHDLASRLRFREMDCHALAFEPASFDVVFADNLFEHVDDPAVVLKECWRVLRPGGLLLVPTFSSIWSKHGLHLKHGLGVPWANLVFSEKTIVEVVKERATREPRLATIYPGITRDPQSVRDLRKHRDLNNITHAEFRTLAATAGFEVETFTVHTTFGGRVIERLGLPTDSPLFDVLSTGAGAVLRRRSG